ncbi:hypothetical protein ACFVFJ_42935 [Streptomyces sp. NPDC057717]|uniref:hypothetical protein n=1 Tax=Streptomyces sp. NPDC057717 TaxID=3346224 RepID=UPI00367BBF62
MGGSSWNVPGAAPSLFIVGGAPLLHPETQVFEGMLAGWRDQQLARNLSKDTIADRLLAVRRFQRFTNEWPWTWRPTDVEEYTAHLLFLSTFMGATAPGCSGTGEVRS